MVIILSLPQHSLRVSLAKVSEPTQGRKSFVCLGISSTNIVCELLIPEIYPTQYQFTSVNTLFTAYEVVLRYPGNDFQYQSLSGASIVLSSAVPLCFIKAVTMWNQLPTRKCLTSFPH